MQRNLGDLPANNGFGETGSIGKSLRRVPAMKSPLENKKDREDSETIGVGGGGGGGGGVRSVLNGVQKGLRSLR